MIFKRAALTLGLITILFPSMVIASTDDSQYNSDLEKSQKSQKRSDILTNFRPPGKGQPQYTVGGATRGNTCATNREYTSEITALVPEKAQSLTLQSHPSLFAYVSPMDEAKLANLIVKDETEDYYYSQQLTIPTSGGIVKMTLAEDAPQLEVNQEYTWFLRIQCHAHLEPEDPQISASIMRVEGNAPDLGQRDLLSFYANSQIWYDSLNSAFELSQSEEDIYWSQLLDNTGMDRFVTK